MIQEIFNVLCVGFFAGCTIWLAWILSDFVGVDQNITSTDSPNQTKQ